MLISHEVPIDLLETSLLWNDYQYVLPHLIDLYPKYKDFMLGYRKTSNSFIICDNGLFENVHHSTDDLINKINLVEPDIFIVPDEWNDWLSTTKNAKYWMNIIKQQLPVKTNLMAVCQGNSMGELTTCYQMFLDLGYKHIAFNHSSKAYTNFYPLYNPLTAQMYGRMEILRQLVYENIIDESVYHHLLGSSDWREFQVYKDWKWIKSLDTSAPIINGALGIKLSLEEQYVKPKEKLEDILNMDFTNADLIDYNVKLFRKSIS